MIFRISDMHLYCTSFNFCRSLYFTLTDFWFSSSVRNILLLCTPLYNVSPILFLLPYTNKQIFVLLSVSRLLHCIYHTCTRIYNRDVSIREEMFLLIRLAIVCNVLHVIKNKPRFKISVYNDFVSNTFSPTHVWPFQLT